MAVLETGKEMDDLSAVAQGEVIESGAGLSLRERDRLVSGGRRGDQNPAAVYLARFSPGSRPAMARALDMIAQIVTDDEEADCYAVPWHAIRYQHAEAIRAVLAERYAHSTANKMLSALRQTLKAAWKLGLMSAEEYQQATSVENVRGETVPAGRAVVGGAAGHVRPEAAVYPRRRHPLSAVQRRPAPRGGRGPQYRRL